jgi:hypothetical protein
MDDLEMARRLRHYGLECVNLAAQIEARHQEQHHQLPVYTPTFPVDFDGVEAVTGRLGCCGAGPDRADERTGERLHLPGCRHVAAAGLADARAALRIAR